jgi:hypothetical protein
LLSRADYGLCFKQIRPAALREQRFNFRAELRVGAIKQMRSFC